MCKGECWCLWVVVTLQLMQTPFITKYTFITGIVSEIFFLYKLPSGPSLLASNSYPLEGFTNSMEVLFPEYFHTTELDKITEIWLPNLFLQYLLNISIL